MCGIIGITDHRNAARLAHLGLFALQHRGQESAGIATVSKAAEDGLPGELCVRVGMGLATEVFAENVLKELKGRSALGHVRYATTGASHIKNAQPLVFNHVHGPIAVAHNGNLTNAAELRGRLETRGAIFQSSTDSEVIVHLVARHHGPVEDAVIAALRQVHGAYSLLLMTPRKLIAIRDPFGFRPLVLGRLGASHALASETTALNLLGATAVREVAPGEMLVIEGGRARSLRPLPDPPRLAHCVFEQVYFARPDSTQFGRNVQATRIALGRELARETGDFLKGQPRIDIVVPVPDSGLPAALGFSRQSGIPLEMGFVRSHYIGRTFIQPGQGVRDLSVALKLSPIRDVLRGKRIVLVDDSIVRGTTSRKICRLLRRQGVRDIHMAISSPPILSPCYYGIDTPRVDELIAANRRLEAIRQYLGVSSLRYLSVDGMLRAAGGAAPRNYCTACFTREYPTPIPDFKTAAETPPERPASPAPLS